MAAVSVFVVWTLAADSLARRFPKVSKAIAGEPIIVVRDGAPLEDRMRRERVTMEDLREAARIEGIGDIEEVEFAVLETDGKFSFITKPVRS